jgi:hypothetical protein
MPFSSEKDKPEVPELVPPFPEGIYDQPFYVAMLIDNICYNVLNCNGEQASQYLSNPQFIQVLPLQARMGWKYDPETGTFSPPKYDPETDTIVY